MLANNRVGDDVLRIKWLDLIPHQMKRILLLVRDQSLEELAAIVDKAHNMGPSVMATSDQPRAPTPSPDSLSQELAALRTAIVQLPTLIRSIAQSRSGSRISRGRTKSRDNSQTAHDRSATPGG